jgi:hypothetical protein
VFRPHRYAIRLCTRQRMKSIANALSVDVSSEVGESEKRRLVKQEWRNARKEKTDDEGCQTMQTASMKLRYLSVLEYGFQDSSYGPRLLLIPRSRGRSRWWRWKVARIHHLVARLHGHLLLLLLLLL